MPTISYFFALPQWFLPALLAALVVGTFLLQFVLLYVLAPFKIRRTQWKERDASYRRVDLTALPPDTAWAFTSAAPQLAALGFKATGHVVHNPAASAGQQGYVSVWVNDVHRTIAQVIGTRTPSHRGEIKVVALVTFRTEFTDKSAIVTSNTSSPGCFPRDPQVDPVTCPHVQDLALLYDLHLRRVHRDAGVRTASVAQATDPARYLADEWRNTFERLTRHGTYCWSEANQRYEPTLRGAFYMTYRLLRPFKQMHLASRDRKANRVLAELGYGGLAQFRAMQRTGYEIPNLTSR